MLYVHACLTCDGDCNAHSPFVVPVQVVLDSLLGLQPAAAASGGGMSKEQLVTAIATDLVDQVPHQATSLLHVHVGNQQQFHCIALVSAGLAACPVQALS